MEVPIPYNEFYLLLLMVILSFQHNTWSAPYKSPWMAVCDESARWERQVKNCIASIGSKRTRYDLSHSNEKERSILRSLERVFSIIMNYLKVIIYISELSTFMVP